MQTSISRMPAVVTHLYPSLMSRGPHSSNRRLPSNFPRLQSFQTLSTSIPQKEGATAAVAVQTRFRTRRNVPSACAVQLLTLFKVTSRRFGAAACCGVFSANSNHAWGEGDETEARKMHRWGVLWSVEGRRQAHIENNIKSKGTSAP